MIILIRYTVIRKSPGILHTKTKGAFKVAEGAIQSHDTLFEMIQP